jgi:hypothetical protein
MSGKPGWCACRTEVANRIRSLLKEFYPAAVATLERGGKHQLHSGAARRLLMHAPTPGEAAKLTKATLAAQLRRAERTRGLTAEAILLQQHLRAEHLVNRLRWKPPPETTPGTRPSA